MSLSLPSEIRDDLDSIAGSARSIQLSPDAESPCHAEVEELTAQYGISSVYADSLVLQDGRAVLLVGTTGVGKTTTQQALVADLEGARTNYADTTILRYKEESLQLLTVENVPTDYPNIPKNNIDLMAYIEGVAPVVLVIFFDDSSAVTGATYDAHEGFVDDRMIYDYMLDGSQFDRCREAVAARLKQALGTIPCLSIAFNYENGEYPNLQEVVDLIKAKIEHL